MPRLDSRLHALRCYRLFESPNLDEARELISLVMQPHSLAPIGHPCGQSHMDFVRIGGLGLGSIRFNCELTVDVRSLDGYYLMMFCTSGEAQVDVTGKRCTASDQRGVIVAPGDSFTARLSTDCEQMILRIDPALMSDHVLEVGQLRSIVGFTSGPMRALRDQLHLIASSLELLGSASKDCRVGAHIESLLISLLIAGQANSDATVVRDSVVPAYVRRAEQFMIANLSAPLRLPEISSAAGVPVETLCNGFQNFRNDGPMNLLENFRLDRARKDILNNTARMRISSIALACGFTHLGRFARKYKERFGELPSVTGKKSQVD